MPMKKLFCLMLSVLLLLLSACGSAAESTRPSTEETEPPVILSRQENFKCHVEYGEEKLEIRDAAAKELYQLVRRSLSEHAYVSDLQEVDSVRLAFYASDQDYPFQQQEENDETYTVYADGLIASSRYPYLSEPFYFKATPELYEQILSYLPNP